MVVQMVLIERRSILQVLSFMFTPNCKWCPLPLKLTGFVLYVTKSCMLCPLSVTQLDFMLRIVMCLSYKGILVILLLNNGLF
ncbi:hypothetical protein Hanom_Chr09g00850541 [Helianthus anomalus]